MFGVALPTLHGPFGEDGTVQGLLELAAIPYVGAGGLRCAIASDKDGFKRGVRDSGSPLAAERDVFDTVVRRTALPVPRHPALRAGDPVENSFGYPVFVKPARLGS